MDMDSPVYHIKTEDFYDDIAKDVQTRFDTSSYREDRPLPIGLNRKVIGMMKDERPKLYSYRKSERGRKEMQRYQEGSSQEINNIGGLQKLFV